MAASVILRAAAPPIHAYHPSKSDSHFPFSIYNFYRLLRLVLPQNHMLRSLILCFSIQTSLLEQDPILIL